MKKTDFTLLPKRKQLLYEQMARLYRAQEPQKHTDWVPFPEKMLDSKITLISVAGAHLKNQQPFTADENESDYDYREINTDFKKEDLALYPIDWDPSEAENDLNVVLPAERLILLQKEGLIGKIDDIIYSFSGCNRNRELLRKNIDKLINALKESQKDSDESLIENTGALIIPASAITSETACFIASQMEAKGISTAVLSLFYEQALILSPPRCAFINFPFGRPLGRAGHVTLHTAILRDTLRLFEKMKSPGLLINLNFIWSSGTIPDW